MLLVDLDAVAEAEHDDLLAGFGHHTIKTANSDRWWQEHLMANGPTDLRDLEGYEEALRKFVQALTPEQRLEGLTPEERLRGLTREELDALADQLQTRVRRRD